MKQSRWDLAVIAISLTLLFAISVHVMAQSTSVSTRVLFDPTVFAAAIVTVITALGVLVVTIINAKSAADDRRDARASRLRLDQVSTATSGKVDVVIEKAVQIHESTNSNLSKVTAALDVALARIEGLQTLVSSMVEAKKIADVLATAPSPVAPSAAQSLDNIDASTKAIDVNTKKTRVDVQDLKGEGK